ITGVPIAFGSGVFYHLIKVNAAFSRIPQPPRIAWEMRVGEHMKLIWKAVVGGTGVLAAAWFFALSTPHWLTSKHDETVNLGDAGLVTRGEYVARAGDCAACHTAPGGKPFAGGLGMQTPLGTI